MKYQQTLGKLAFLAILVITTSQCQRGSGNIHAQDPDVPISVAGAQEIGPILQGKADGNILPFPPTTDNLKDSILAHPFPEIWLVFPAQKGNSQQVDSSNGKGSTITIELSSEAKSLLLHHWQVALTFCYNTELQHPPDGQSLINEDSRFLQSVTATERELEKVAIAAPDGNRQICHNEAVSLTRFLTLAASNVIKQAKK